jgi:hypothetical protein
MSAALAGIRALLKLGLSLLDKYEPFYRVQTQQFYLKTVPAGTLGLMGETKPAIYTSTICARSFFSLFDRRLKRALTALHLGRISGLPVFYKANLDIISSISGTV